MKCKVCSNELRVGAKRCPNCGAEVPAAGKMASEVFKWNVQDFPKPKKKADVTIDWSAGKIVNKQSGRVYKQSANMWSEPEEVKNLFTFEKKNEDFQEILDKQMETIEAAAPEVKIEEPMVFDLPSSMDMGLFEELISDDVEILLPEKGSDSPVIEFKIAEDKAPAAEKAEAAADIPVKEDKSDVQEAVSLSDIFDTAEVPAAKEEKPAAEKAKSEDEVVFSGIRKLMEAEEKFKQDMERVTYLTPAEAEKAEKIEDNSNKLRFVPTFSFRSIEDEYEAYRSESGIAKSGSDQNKEVNIEINEPSGTKVTVKTQEINIANTPDADGFKTQEVHMDSLKQGPTNVQVSVEVNSAGGNASVEVTRKHDGSTVVKTIDESSMTERVVVQEENELDEAEVVEEAAEIAAEEAAVEETAEAVEEAVDAEASEEEKSEEVPEAEAAEEEVQPEEAAEKDEEAAQAAETEEFWKNSDTSNTSATRMTITDIFGPDARKIIEGFEENADEDIKNSLILDIKPEDIAVTEEQAVSINGPSGEETAAEKVAEAATAAVAGAAAAAVAEAVTEEQPQPSEEKEEIPQEAAAPQEEAAPAEAVVEEEKKSGFGKAAKAFIAILVIILIAEFSVIGIKLFAPDSQAALFVERVQDSVVSVVSDVIDGGADDAGDADQQADGGDAQQDGAADQQQDAGQQTDDTQQTDPNAAQTPAGGDTQAPAAQ